MPIGIVSDNDFDLELNKCKTFLKEQLAEVRDKTPLGRGINHTEVPESLRKIIGATSELEGRESALTLANEFGISSSSVSAYANGSTSTASYRSPNPSLKNHINSAKERISKKAQNRLIHALNGITPEKLAEAKLRDISSVARDMAAIVKDMEVEEVKDTNQNGPTFVFYAPQIRREDQFDVIDMSNE